MDKQSYDRARVAVACLFLAGSIALAAWGWM